jgi:acetyl-CoA C-acetyltransferase
MSQPVVLGIGYSGFQPSTSHYNIREMIYEAAAKAYEDAGGIDPGSDVDAFVSCQEDFWEGISINDEFVPDQLGAVLKPVYTISGDSLQCVLSAYSMIRSGAFDVVVVESHGKPSEILTMRDIILMSYDPIYIRPLNPENVFVFNALEAKAFMEYNKIDREALGRYVISSLRKGLRGRRNPYASIKNVEAYLEEEYVVEPLTKLDFAPYSDAAVVVVITSEDVAKKFSDEYIKISGVWSVSGTSSIVYDDLREDTMTKIVARKVFDMTGIKDPVREIGVFEIDERISHVPLMVIKALRLSEDVNRDLMMGRFDEEGDLPVNPFGGALSEGNVLEAHGLARLVNAYEILKGSLGSRRYSDVEKILIHSRRWPSSRTTTLAILSR